MKVYPNPAEDYIIVSFDELFDEEYEAEVLSIEHLTPVISGKFMPARCCQSSYFTV